MIISAPEVEKEVWQARRVAWEVGVRRRCEDQRGMVVSNLQPWFEVRVVPRPPSRRVRGVGLGVDIGLLD